jgi:hypothetical protein
LLKKILRVNHALWYFMQILVEFMQNKPNFRLNEEDLLTSLESWDAALESTCLLVACGGTALTLQGYKVTTKDVDFLVPDDDDLREILRTIQDLGYVRATGHGYRHPTKPWIFDLFRGQRVFQTDLLDSVHEPSKHKVIKDYGKLLLAALNSDDLIISKMFRGDQSDGR